MDHYVYEHITLDHERFYIGMGKGNRCKDGYNGRNKSWHEKTPNGFRYNILMGGLSKGEALELEKFIIQEIGYEKLVNIKNSRGGRKKGCSNPSGEDHPNYNKSWKWKKK